MFYKVGDGMEERVILHVDLNCFYASVEQREHEEYRGKPLAVCGAEELRHGIVLTKSYEAKKFGIKTGDTNWEARKKCKDIIIVPPDFSLYLKYSAKARAIYEDYSDNVESFGIDECWVDVTHSTCLFGDGKKIADTIRKRLKEELGITASVGVSYNKVFAKLGSDYKKPDATTVITRSNYKRIVYPLPVADLLYVGKHTEKKLLEMGITTIGDLAECDESALCQKFGVIGSTLHDFANGSDSSSVKKCGVLSVVKSVGNSVTTIRDIKSYQDAEKVIHLLADSVGMRLRTYKFFASTVTIYVRFSDLLTVTKQGQVCTTCYSSELAEKACELYKSLNVSQPVRCIGVKASNLITDDVMSIQCDMFGKVNRSMKATTAERCSDRIREKFGSHAVRKGILILNEGLTDVNPKEEHIIHPKSFFL